MTRRFTQIAIVFSAALIAGCGNNGTPQVIVTRQGKNVGSAVSDPSAGPEIDGNGKAAVESRDVAAFRKIRTDGSIDITIRPAPHPKVTVAGDANVLPSVVTRSQDGLLTISERGDLHSKTPLSIEVSGPEPEHLTLDGSGSAHLEGIKTKRLGIDLNGSGGVDGYGAADALSLDLSGSGSANLTGLKAGQAEVSVSGSGNAAVTATQAISASDSGAGNIVFSGNPPVITKSVTGTGSVSAK